MIRILITDDHATIRECLKNILTEEFKDIEFGEAASGYEALDKARTQAWDVMIMDVTMPGLNGIATLKQLRKENIQTPVLVMSFNADDSYAARVVKAGASAFIAKDNAYQDLIAAIRFLMSNKARETKGMSAKNSVHKENPIHNLIASYEAIFMDFIYSVKHILKG